MIRSIGAVIGGYLVFGVAAVLLFKLTGRSPEVWPGWRFAIFATAHGTVFAAAAGTIAARLAPRAPFGHAAVVAGLMAAVAIVSAVAQPAASPWSEIATVLVFAPAVLLGATGRIVRNA